MINTKNIKIELIKKEMTVTELARELGLKTSSLNHYIHNRRSIPAVVAVRLAKYLGLHIEDIIEIEQSAA